MKKLILLITYCFVISTSFAINRDSIVIKPNSKYFFNIENEKLNPRQLYAMVKKIPESKLEMQNARFNRTVAQTLGFAGGFLFGYGIARMAIYKNANKIGFLGLGVICCAISIPFDNAYTKHARHAVHYYNLTEK